ncbi:MAG: hypothetical protein ACKO4A_08470, partial [Gammaproteobacteria bacterium]
MNPSDKALGMDRRIRRRDFINGAAVGVAGEMFPFGGASGASSAGVGVYPPARTGLGGSTPGAFGVARELAWSGKCDWGRVHDADAGAPYD